MVVECHSGHIYAERPTAVWWQGERIEVEAVEQQWRTPQGKWFRVRTRDGRVFELLYSETKDEWRVNMPGDCRK